MGIQITDPFTTHFGVALTNVYVSLAETDIMIIKDTNTNPSEPYTIYCNFSVHATYQARVDNKPTIDRCAIQLTSASPFTTDIYTLVYNALKAQFPNYVDM